MGLLDVLKNLFGGSSTPEDDSETREAQELARQAAELGPTGFEPWNDLADSNNMEEYAYRCGVIDLAYAKGPQEFANAAAKFGIRNQVHYSKLQASFNQRFSSNPSFMQVLMNGKMRAAQATMQAAASPGMFEPIEGVDLKTYATIQSRRAAVPPNDPAAFARLLAEYGIDEPKFARVDSAWLARMRNAGDPMATAAIATEYGKYFAAAGQGQYAAQAHAASAGMGLNSKAGAGVAPSTDGAASLERYAEVMAAQAVWSEQGHDIAAMLQKTFNMSIADYSNMGAYWSQRITADYTLAMKLNELQERFRAKYLAGQKSIAKGGLDDDLKL